MSDSTLREALARIVSTRDATKQRIAADLDIAINGARVALAADDAARGTMRGQFEAWAQEAGLVLTTEGDASDICGTPRDIRAADYVLSQTQWAFSGFCAGVAWQASRAAAPQSVEPVAYCDPVALAGLRGETCLAVVLYAASTGYASKPLYLAPPVAPTDAEWREKVEAELANIALNYGRARDRWSGCRNPDGSLNNEKMDEAHGFEGKANDCLAALRARIATRPVQEWSDAKLRGIASDYFPDAKDWPAAMLCMRHLLMEQAKYPAPPTKKEQP